MTCDYLICEGLVVDGQGTEPAKLNVGIKGDRIIYLGTMPVPAREVIDARGFIVSPGFIDTHGHSEFTLIADGRAEGKVSQGITTEINGNCGLSAAPLYGDSYLQREGDFREYSIQERWSSFEEYQALLELKGSALNVATLCGHGNLRASVMGYRNVPADEVDMMKMKELLHVSLTSGARGLSTGLIYPPGIYATTEELINLSKTMASFNSLHGITQCLYVSHMRSEGDRLLEAIDEVLRIGRDAGVAVHISHIKTSGRANWGKIDKVINALDNARDHGIRLTCDRYPYIASSTDLDTVLPRWVYEGGIHEEIKRLNTPSIRDKIRSEVSSIDHNVWECILISSVSRSGNKWMEGRNVLYCAEKLRKTPVDYLLDLLTEEEARVGAIFFSMNENNLIRFLKLPYVMIGSDSSARSFSGVTAQSKPHPRGFGSFPCFLGAYVRERGIMDISHAIQKITSLPAATFGLHNRGMLKQGFFADITIFDYGKIMDKATFENPFLKAAGIAYVFVNGIPVIKAGELTGFLPGRSIR